MARYAPPSRDPFTYLPLASVSACCSAAPPVVLCILQPSPSAPHPASPSLGSAAPETTCSHTGKVSLGFGLFATGGTKYKSSPPFFQLTSPSAPEIVSPDPTSHPHIHLSSAHSLHHPSLHRGKKQKSTVTNIPEVMSACNTAQHLGLT